MSTSPPPTSSSSTSTILLPPHRIPITTPSIFLAGSIEMGKAIDWQSSLSLSLISTISPTTTPDHQNQPKPITIFNPRRADWDSSWIQDISCPQFAEQVNWELDYIKQADVVALFLQPGTLSPISLLELGLIAGEMGMGSGSEQGNREGEKMGEVDGGKEGKKGKLVVCCPEGYWRRGNVQVVCQRYGVELVETLEEMERACVERLREAGSRGR